MSYTINLVYKDGNTLNVDIPEDEYQSFFGCLNEGKVFWGKLQAKGFWTNLEDVRYMLINSQATAQEAMVEAMVEAMEDGIETETDIESIDAVIPIIPVIEE